MSKGLILLFTSILLHFVAAYPNAANVSDTESNTRFIITDGNEVSDRYIDEDQIDSDWRIGDLFPASFGQDFPSRPSFEGILIKDADCTNGKWYYKNRNGTQWVNITLNNYLVNIDDHLRFVPNPDYYSAEPVLLTASLYIVGGEHSSPFSVNNEYSGVQPAQNNGLILQVFVNAINDAPVIKPGTENIYKQVKENEAQKGWNIADLFKNSFDDSKDNPDPDSFAGIMVTRIDNSTGLWEYRTSDTAPWQQIDPMTVINATFLSWDAQIRYTSTTPCGNHNNTPSAILQAKVCENQAGTTIVSGTIHDVSDYNPTGYFSQNEVSLTAEVLCKLNPNLGLDENQWKVYTGKKLYVNPVSITNTGGKDDLLVTYEYVKDGVTTDHALNAGTYYVTAKTAGNDDNNPTQSNTITFIVQKASAVINFPAIGTKIIGSAAFNLNASISSGQTITYGSSDNSVAEVSATGVVTMKKVGFVEITAMATETENYLATFAQRTLSVIKVTPILTLTQNQAATYTGGNLYITPAVLSNVINNANLPVTYKYSKDGVLTDHALNVGVYTVTAEIMGDSEHFAVQSNSIQFTVEKTLTGIIFDPIETKVIGSAPFSLNVSAGANQNITYKSSDESIAEVSATGIVTMKKVGNITITVTVDGGANHLPISASQGLNIIKVTPVLTLGNTPSKVYTGSPLRVDPAIVSNVINNANLPVTYKYVKNGVATDHALNAGTYTVTAQTVGNEEHFAVDSNPITFVVEKAPSIITFAPIGTKFLDTASFGLNVTANGNQNIIYKSSDASIAEVSVSGVVTIKNTGSVTITAIIADEENYLSASESQILNIISDYIKLYIDNKEWDIKDRYIVADDYTGNTLGVEIETELGATVNIEKKFMVDVSKPGVVHVYFTVTSQDGSTSKDYHLEIEKQFPFSSLIVQKWNNTLAVNNNPSTNGGYKFVAYKWFKNGIEVSNLGYYSEGSSINDILNPLDEFYVELTTDKGEVFHTSKAHPVLRDMKVKAYPNPASTGETVYVDIDMDSESLENGTIEVYNMLGIKVLSTKVQQQATPISIPNISGTYILKLKTDVLAKELRVIVK